MTMSDRSDPSEKSGCRADVDADAAVKLVQKAGNGKAAGQAAGRDR